MPVPKGPVHVDEDLDGPILATVAQLQQSLKEAHDSQQEARDCAMDVQIRLHHEEQRVTPAQTRTCQHQATCCRGASACPKARVTEHRSLDRDGACSCWGSRDPSQG